MTKLDVTTVSHLFMTNAQGALTQEFNHNILQGYDDQHLKIKLQNLHIKLKHNIQNTHTAIGYTSKSLLHCQVLTGSNISQTYMKFRKKQLDTEIGEPPARQARIRDNIITPDLETFQAGYNVLHSPLIPSKTKEITFQILNRTLWATNKAHNAGETDTPHCAYCGHIETIEHMIVNCDNYAYLQWELLQQVLSDYLTQVHNSISSPQGEGGGGDTLQQDTPIQVTLQYQHIIYHKPLQQLRTYKLPRTTAQVTTSLIAEIILDIYRRKIQHLPPQQLKEYR